MRLIPLAMIAGFWTGAALAAPATPPPAPNVVSPVTVFGKTEAPKIVRSYPAAGQAMSAGVLVLSVTFDQPMLKTGFDFGPAPGGEPPHCLKTPRLLNDNKTFVLLCTTEPHKAYALSFNARPQGGFENVAEHRAEPAILAFSTTDGDGPNDIHAAMKAANLRDIDMPIEDTPDLGAEKAGP
ncbi:MAG: hypothetical protein ACHP9T_13255 [Caulobacterales bacterium]|jgi:hypothetical protein